MTEKSDSYIERKRDRKKQRNIKKESKKEGKKGKKEKKPIERIKPTKKQINNLTNTASKQTPIHQPAH